jgi:hypothetical protein
MQLTGGTVLARIEEYSRLSLTYAMEWNGRNNANNTPTKNNKQQAQELNPVSLL